MDGIAMTSRWTAASRARESERPDRLFHDPLAGVLAGEIGFQMLDRMPEKARENPWVPIRCRYFDDWALGCAVEHGLRQLVLVAAGMDTRAFRFTWPPDMRIWELDRPELQAVKAALLDGAGAEARCQRVAVGADLAATGWPERLGEAGFATGSPAAWLVEGLLMYLDEDAVDRVLDAIGAVAAPGSRLALDVLSADYAVQPWMREYLASMRSTGRPWRFGTDEPVALLERHGWRVERVAEPGEDGASYGRWPWPPAAPGMTGLTRAYLVTAVRP